jgi:hypothetical protein
LNLRNIAELAGQPDSRTAGLYYCIYVILQSWPDSRTGLLNLRNIAELAGQPDSRTAGVYYCIYVILQSWPDSRTAGQPDCIIACT